MDSGAWQATDHGVAESRTQRSKHTAHKQTLDTLKESHSSSRITTEHRQAPGRARQGKEALFFLTTVGRKEWL